MAKTYLVYIDPQIIKCDPNELDDEFMLAWLQRNIANGTININVKEIPNG